MAELKNPPLDLIIDDDIAKGVYSNLAVISHSASEFVLDFAALLPGMAKPHVCSRVILTPDHAKRLLLSLQDNVTRYENNIGRIDVGSHGKSAMLNKLGEA